MLERIAGYLAAEPVRVTAFQLLPLIALIGLLVWTWEVDHWLPEMYEVVLGVYAVAAVVWLIVVLRGPVPRWADWTSTAFDVLVVVVLGSAFFCCLSITIAGIVMSRERLMGIGQAITMPLFFASNALYPVDLMPTWLQVLNHINPLSYEVDALRGLLLGTPATLALDFGVLVGTAVLGIGVASALLPRLAR